MVFLLLDLGIEDPPSFWEKFPINTVFFPVNFETLLYIFKTQEFPTYPIFSFFPIFLWSGLCDWFNSI